MTAAPVLAQVAIKLETVVVGRERRISSEQFQLIKVQL